jgi:hypothetical protein
MCLENVVKNNGKKIGLMAMELIQEWQSAFDFLFFQAREISNRLNFILFLLNRRKVQPSREC